MKKQLTILWISLIATLLAGCELLFTPSAGDELNIVINEVNTSAKYIELYNKGDQPADISGLTIVKNNEGPIGNTDGSADLWTARAIVSTTS